MNHVIFLDLDDVAVFSVARSELGMALNIGF